jgi:hypothetical protein
MKVYVVFPCPSFIGIPTLNNKTTRAYESRTVKSMSYGEWITSQDLPPFPPDYSVVRRGSPDFLYHLTPL